jgi:hypothetical protein
MGKTFGGKTLAGEHLMPNVGDTGSLIDFFS